MEKLWVWTWRSLESLIILSPLLFLLEASKSKIIRISFPSVQDGETRKATKNTY